MWSSLWRPASPAVIIAALVIGVAAASPVSAQVSVRADNPVVGGFTKLTFRAPSESDDSATTSIEITIPQRPPVLFVRLRPHPGWTVTTKQQKLANPQTFEGERVDSLVTEIVLTAEKDKGIPARQFDEFDLTAGPLPNVPALEFPVVQKYDDGREVTWNERWTERGQIPRHPVPRIVLPAHADRGSRPAPTDPVARWLGGGGLAVAVVALAVVLLRRRPYAAGRP